MKLNGLQGYFRTNISNSCFTMVDPLTRMMQILLRNLFNLINYALQTGHSIFTHSRSSTSEGRIDNPLKYYVLSISEKFMNKMGRVSENKFFTIPIYIGTLFNYIIWVKEGERRVLFFCFSSLYILRWLSLRWVLQPLRRARRVQQILQEI
jgi:hypothetical protein